MKYIKRLVFSTLLLILFSSCNFDRKAWSSEDSWYNPWNSDYSEWTEVEDSLIIIINLDKMDLAEKLLENSSVVKLSNEECYYFLSDSSYKQKNNEYLVRAVYLQNFTKGYSIYNNEDTLIITHGSLGKEAVEMKHHALILNLPFQPKKLYSECYMDE